MINPGSLPLFGWPERGLPDGAWVLYGADYEDGEIVHKSSQIKGIIEIKSLLTDSIEMFSKLD